MRGSKASAQASGACGRAALVGAPKLGAGPAKLSMVSYCWQLARHVTRHVTLFPGQSHLLASSQSQSQDEKRLRLSLCLTLHDYVSRLFGPKLTRRKGKQPGPARQFPNSWFSPLPLRHTRSLSLPCLLPPVLFPLLRSSGSFSSPARRGDPPRCDHGEACEY